MVVDVTVVDDGLGSGRSQFILKRRARMGCESVSLATVPRRTGPMTHRYCDGPPPSNTAFEYSNGRCNGFTWVHDGGDGLPITQLCMIAGPGTAPIGHGYLPTSGMPWWLPGCRGSDCDGGNVVTLPPEAVQYASSNTAAMLCGSFIRSSQRAWFLDVRQVMPMPCTVGVAPVRWDTVTQLER
jgi:hypothetical protein